MKQAHFSFLFSLFLMTPIHAFSQAQIQSHSLRSGTLTVSASWLKDPETEMDVLRGKVSFLAGSNAPQCGSIRLIQVARTQDASGNDLVWDETSGQAPRMAMMTRSGHSTIMPGYFVDHSAIRCRQGRACSPFFRDHWVNERESQDGSNQGNGPVEASLIDYPFGWDGSLSKISLEACAFCNDSRKFLGCVTWGGEWPLVGERKLSSNEFSNGPSATFQAAFRLFQDYYRP